MRSRRTGMEMAENHSPTIPRAPFAPPGNLLSPGLGGSTPHAPRGPNTNRSRVSLLVAQFEASVPDRTPELARSQTRAEQTQVGSNGANHDRTQRDSIDDRQCIYRNVKSSDLVGARGTRMHSETRAGESGMRSETGEQAAATSILPRRQPHRPDTRQVSTHLSPSEVTLQDCTVGSLEVAKVPPPPSVDSLHDAKKAAIHLSKQGTEPDCHQDEASGSLGGRHQLWKLSWSTSTSPAASENNNTLPTRIIQCVPASEVFDRRAKPLLLPEEVDEAIRHLGRLAHFTSLDAKDLFGSDEKIGWESWRNQPQDAVFHPAFLNIIDRLQLSRRYSRIRGKARPSAAVSAACDSPLIFPPYHLLKNGKTVSDYKFNHTTPLSAFGIQSLAEIGVNGALAAAASTYGIKYITVETFRDLIQMSHLFGSVSGGGKAFDHWSSRIPAIVSLDLVSAFGRAIMWYWIFTAVGAFLVYEIYRFTGGWGMSKPYQAMGEGFDRVGLRDRKGNVGSTMKWRDGYAYRTTVTFLATSLYLPLSKIAIGSLVWSDDFWVVPDPFDGSKPPDTSALGDAALYYPRLDFCYRTTMRRRSGLLHFNFGWLIVPISSLTILWLTLFLPYRLFRLAQREAPSTDGWTELGQPRADVDGEYARLLERDRSPFSFLYREYRRPWAAFKALYMLFKLLNVTLIVVLDRANCVFRFHTSSWIAIIRQATLVGVLFLFLMACFYSRPYIDHIANNSDVVNRIGYTIIAGIGLLVAMDVKDKAALGGGVLLTVNVVVYSINAYFTFIGTQFAQRFIKGVQRRLDTSIDIFSPHLDLTKHLGRRVWAETISIIIMAAPAYQMDEDVRPVFSVLERTASERSHGADHLDGPSPTLLGFRGSVAERLVECTKIIRSIGIEKYVQELASGDDDGLVEARARVFRDLTGPDVYYRPDDPSMVPSCVTTFFGRLDVVPFPFMALLRYDQSPSTIVRLTSRVELFGLIGQNERADVIGAKNVRSALRALEGATVLAPFSLVQLVGSRFLTKTQVVSQFRTGKITIRRNNDMTWEGYNYSSGFEASIQYEDGEGIDENGQVVHGQKAKVSLSELGLTPEFALSQGMAKLFLHNRRLIAARFDRINDDLRNHRQIFFEDAQLKVKTLSYGFLIDILGTSSLTKLEVANWAQKREFNPSIKSMVARWNASFTYVEERMSQLSSNPIRAWWYLLWDDIWRRNHRDIEPLRSRPEAFSPFYRTSICYGPLPRSELEVFLVGQGFSVDAASRGYFNPGFLNRVYFYIGEMLSASMLYDIPIHTASSPSRLLSLRDLDRHGRSSRREINFSRRSHDTGDGTSYDTLNLRPRAAFPYEQAFDAPRRGGILLGQGRFGSRMQSLGQALAIWFGLVPVKHTERIIAGQELMLDLEETSEHWRMPGSVHQCAKQPGEWDQSAIHRDGGTGVHHVRIPKLNDT